MKLGWIKEKIKDPRYIFSTLLLFSLLFYLRIISLSELLLTGALGGLYLCLKKILLLQENFLNLELRVAQLVENSENKTKRLNLSGDLLKKISLSSLHSKNEQEKILKLESQSISHERIKLKKLTQSWKLPINSFSVKEWQELLKEEQLTSDQLETLIKFLGPSKCFTREGKKRLLAKALKIYEKEASSSESFLSLCDTILEQTGFPFVAYYALRCCLTSKESKKLETYLHYCCLHPEELTEAQRVRLNFILGELRIQKMPVPEKTPSSLRHYSPDSKKIFYVLHNSEPYMTFGYASRARGVMKSMEKEGYTIYGVTRLGFPYDRYDLKENLPSPHEIPIEESISGLSYLRLLSKDGKGLFEKPLDDYMMEAKEAIVNLAYLKKPSVILAASNFYTAFPALLAARELGIPFVYEVRGFWEVTRYSRDPDWIGTHAHQFYEEMENKIVLAADKVFTLTEAMKNLIEKRAKGEVPVDLVPNAVTPRENVNEQKDPELLKKLGLRENEKVIGFIGSVVEYEGLSLLVQAAAQLENLPCKFLIVGTGSSWEDLKKLTKDYEVEEKFIFTGRVPHSEVSRYYSVIDLVTLPRLSLPVCELVSPLKPFEAMAEKKLLLMSDVAAMKEFSKPGVNSFLFEKGNLDSLVQQIKKILFSGENFDEVKTRSRDWVIENRTWDHAAEKIKSLLQELP